MDEIVVRTKVCDTLIEDLRETFGNLNKMQLKLNLENVCLGCLPASSSGSWYLIGVSR